jgi:acyl-CoA synthetase
MKTLAETIASHADRQPDAIAFYGDDSSMNWAEYAARSDRLAGLLAELELERGDRVAVVLPDGPGVHAAFVGVEKAGLVTMGIGPRAGRAELAHLLRKSGARALVSRARYRDLDTARFVEEVRTQGLPLHHHIVASSTHRLLSTASGASPPSRARRASAGPRSTTSSCSTRRRARPGCPSA